MLNKNVRPTRNSVNSEGRDMVYLFDVWHCPNGFPITNSGSSEPFYRGSLVSFDKAVVANARNLFTGVKHYVSI